jgi:hypothetical protein
MLDADHHPLTIEVHTLAPCVLKPCAFRVLSGGSQTAKSEQR